MEATCMFIDPTGKLLNMQELLPYFEVLTFSNILFKNYIFSGISLLIVNGISNLIATYLLFKDKKIGIILGTLFGFTLMLWITIQFIILPLNMLSTTFFIFGLLQLIIGYITLVFYTQEQFKFNIKKYKNKDNLVVYFSRMGYTKQIAYEKANDLGASILELKTKEKTEGTLGFWWCGRYGKHKWRMPIEDIKLNLKDCKHIIIVTPIRVFNISAPMRDFCYKYSKDIKSVEYIFTHFMKTKFKNVADEMDKILNIKRKKTNINMYKIRKNSKRNNC